MLHPAFLIAFLRAFGIVAVTMVIRMRHTRSHTKNRRSHHGLKDPNLSTCTNCGAKHRPHHMCLECGYYNGRQVMDLEAEKAKRDARIQAKKEIIRNELGATADEPVAEESKEESPVEDVKEENTETAETEDKKEEDKKK